MIKSLSSKQKKVYDYYKAFIKSNEASPTYQQAAEDLNISPSVVHSHIKNLEKIWYLFKDRSGGVQIVNTTARIPVLGSIACGEPISVYENAEEEIDVAPSLLSGGSNFYALIARGESMIDEGISDGDYLIIRQQSDVNDGDIAVVITGESSDEGATLKKVYKKPQALLLQPANPVFEPMIIKNNASIRGKLVSVMRNY